MAGSPIAVIIAGLNTFPEIFDLMEARLDSVGDGPIVQSMTTSPGPLKKPDFFVRRARVAGRYSVSVAIPNGMEDDICQKVEQAVSFGERRPPQLERSNELSL